MVSGNGDFGKMFSQNIAIQLLRYVTLQCKMAATSKTGIKRKAIS
jgi:hypothetical protein